jgi:multicomponent Na+:H+ antiporter subunit G
MVSTVVEAVAVVFVVTGTFFLVVSAIGLVRLPDFYTRAHAVAKSETLGIMLVLIGLLIHHAPTAGSFQLVLIIIFAYLANPTAVHALARVALRHGVRPWTNEEQP